METLTKQIDQPSHEDLYDEAEANVQRVLENPEVQVNIEADMEGGDFQQATDAKGNEVSQYASSVDITQRAVYHVQGGAENGGKTYKANVSVENDPSVIIETKEGIKLNSRNGKLASKVIGIASSAIERNSRN